MAMPDQATYMVEEFRDGVWNVVDAGLTWEEATDLRAVAMGRSTTVRIVLDEVMA